jgi:DNA-binding response OmpR family regulator
MTSQHHPRAHILVADPDPVIRERVAATIAATEEMQPVQAGSVSLATVFALGRDPAIGAILMGLDFADESGIEFCQRLRRQGVRLPILLMARHPGEQDIVDCLDAGANDVIALPHRPAELVARLRAHLRCHAWCDDVSLPLGPYIFRPAQRLLQETGSQRRIRLTDKEAAVLKFLHRAGGEPVGRRALLREVWGYAPGASTHTVETHIYRLRRKIEPDATRTQLLMNDGGGYRLVTEPSLPQAARPPAARPRVVLPALAMGAAE